MKVLKRGAFAIGSGLLVPAILLASGCTNLMYGERTGFNLGMFVNSDPAKPVKINAGLERSVGTVAPPVSSDGESVSMVSHFSLTQTEGYNLLNEELTISTDFASGEAATGLTATQAQSIFDDSVTTFAETDLTRRINGWVGTNKSANLTTMRSWIDTWNTANKTRINEFDIRFGRGFEAERTVLVNDLNLP